MPDRIVRDEVLDSDRYLDLPSDSPRMLFMHFLLVADDLGNAEATPAFIRRRLLARSSDQDIERMIVELTTGDLVRPYLVDGKRYVHIPRFRQRLRSYKRVNPRPPKTIECKEISKLITDLSATCPTNDGQLPALAGEGRKEGRKEEKEGSTYSNGRVGAVDKSKAGDKSPSTSPNLLPNETLAENRARIAQLARGIVKPIR